MQDPYVSKQLQKPECYQTGNILPKKRKSGLIAMLLILVILLCGIVSVLGLMNIHLFRALLNQKEESSALAFESSPAEEHVPAVIAQAPAPVSGRTALGIIAQDITAFEASFYRVPQGIYVTSVLPHTDAYQQGLRAKDIILSFDGIENLTCDSLQELLNTRQPGDQVMLTVYRRGSNLDLQITLYNDED